jgi:hypothetical protein
MLPAWNVEAKRLSARANIRSAHIANRVGKARGVVFRYLNNKRQPNPEMTAQLNKAIGDLAGDPAITAYLNFVDAIERSDISDAQMDLWREAASICIEKVSRFLLDNAPAKIASRINELPQAKAFVLYLELNEWWRRSLIRRIDGTVAKKSELDEILGIFKSNGLDLENLKRPADEFGILILEARVISTIRRALVEASPADPVLRARLERTIERAFIELREAEQRRLDHLIAKEGES